MPTVLGWELAQDIVRVDLDEKPGIGRRGFKDNFSKAAANCGITTDALHFGVAAPDDTVALFRNGDCQ